MEIGHINFLNCLPLTYYYKTNRNDDLQIKYDIPAKLNEALINQNLMISPVSSIVYARNYQNLLILPNLSIMADGKVESIFLVSKKPIEELNNVQISLTPQSATSHCLLKIILNKKYNLHPRCVIESLDIENIFDKTSSDAALFIGDNALYINNNRQDNLFYYDLGMLWKELTGKCMVYALWVVNEDFAKDNREIIAKVQSTIRYGFDYGMQNLDEAIEKLDANINFSSNIINEYLHIIKWDLQNEQIEALKLFYQYAYELNLIDEIPKIKIFVN